MTEGCEVTIAGKRYESTAAYFRMLLGSLRSLATQHGTEPVQVTIKPDGELSPEAIESLR